MITFAQTLTMTYKILLVAAVLSLQQLSAQQLLFPKQNYKDSIALSQTIPALAQQVITLYHSSDKPLYYDGMLRFCLLTGQYELVAQYIDFDRRRQGCQQPGQPGLDQLDGVDDVRARLAEHAEDEAAMGIRPGGELGVFDAVDHGADI